MKHASLKRTLLFAFLSQFLISGCSLWSVDSKLGTTDEASSAEVSGISMAPVANDFVKALRQIPSLAPANTTVNLLAEFRDDAFALSIRQALGESGYALRWADNTASQYLLSYRREQEASVAGTDRVRFDIALGSVELRRTYLIMKTGTMRPVTPMYVKGADAQAIVLDDTVFDDQASERALATLPTLTVPVDANPLTTLIPASLNAKPLTLPLVALPEVQNVFEIGGSNFTSKLARHKIVAEQILTFPNDSLRLGTTNKQLIGEMVERFDPVTDVFSLIGCSLGPTRVTGGNAALALGRASRVREALLFSGVSQNNILDEGCWAGDSAANTLPARGVVITLNRQT